MYGILQYLVLAKEEDASAWAAGAPDPVRMLRSRLAATAAIADALLEAGQDATLNEIGNLACDKLLAMAAHNPDVASMKLVRGISAPQPHSAELAACISPVGWLYDTVERTTEVAAAISRAVRASEAAAKAAQCLAALVFLARTGEHRMGLFQCVTKFGYDMRSMEHFPRLAPSPDNPDNAEMVHALTPLVGIGMRNSCQNMARLCPSIDVACMAGSLAEAYYGPSPGLEREARLFLGDPEISRIEQAYRKAMAPCEGIGCMQIVDTDALDEPNDIVREALRIGQDLDMGLRAELVSGALLKSLKLGGKLLLMMDTPDTIQSECDALARRVLLDGEKNPVTIRVRARPSIVHTWDMGCDPTWNMPRLVALFTHPNELNWWCGTRRGVVLSVREALETALLADEMEGIIINPFSQYALLDREDIGMILAAAGVRSARITQSAKVVPLSIPKDHLAGNHIIEEALSLAEAKGPTFTVLDSPRAETLSAVEEALVERATQGGHLLIGYALGGNYAARDTLMRSVDALLGNGPADVRASAVIIPGYVRSRTGDARMAAFTSKDVMGRWAWCHNPIEVEIRDALRLGLKMESRGGLMLNPFTTGVELSQDRLELLLRKIQEVKAKKTSEQP